MPILFSILLALSHFTALASPKMTAGQVSLLEKIILGYYYEPSKLIKPLGDHLGSCGAFDANSHGAQHVARVASIIPYIWDIQWKNFPERRQALKDFSNYYKISTYHLRFLVQIAGIMHDSGNKYGNWHKDMPYSQKDAIWENISTKYFQDLIESPHTLSTYLPQNPKLRKELAISLSQIIQHKNTPGKIQTTHKHLLAGLEVMRLTLDLSDAIDVMRVREKIDTCSFIKKLIGKSSVSTTTEQSLIVFTDQLSVTNLYLIMQQHDLHTHLTLTTCKRGRQSTHTRNFKQAYYPFTETQTLIKHNLGYFETHMKGF